MSPLGPEHLAAEPPPTAPPKAWYSRLRPRVALLVLLGTVPSLLVILLLLRAQHVEAIAFESERLGYVAERVAAQQDVIIDAAQNLAKLLVRDPRLQHPEAADCPALLREVQQSGNLHILNVLVMRPDGEAVCSGVPFKGNLLPRYAGALAEAERQDGPLVGDVAPGIISHKLGIPVYQALRDTHGQLLGVLGLGLDLEWVSRAARGGRSVQQQTVGLMRTDGTVVFRSPDLQGWTGRDASKQPMFLAMRASAFRGITQTQGLSGQERIVAFAPFGQSGGKPLILWVSESVEEVKAAVPQTPLVLGVIALLLMLLLSLGTWALADKLVGRVSRVSKLAERLSRGEVTTRAWVDSDVVELATLGGAFDTMAESLQRMDETVRANQALKVLLAVRGTREEGDDESELLTAVCARIVEAGGYKAAWVMRAGKPGRIVASHGGHPELGHAHDAAWQDHETSGCVAQRTILERQPVVIADLDAEMAPATWRHIRAELGLRSAISLPIIDAQGVFGALVICAVEANAFGATELALLAETTADVAAKLTAQRDRHEKRLTEGKLRRVSREQRMLAAANRAILYATDEAELLQSVCAVLTDVGGYTMSWLGRAEDDEARRVTPLAHSGRGAAYVAEAAITWADDERGRGPTGQCIRAVRTVAVQHIDSDANLAPWRERALENGFTSVLATPLLPANGHASMALLAYSANPDAFDAEEVRLLESLAENLGYGINALRQARAREAAEVEVRKLTLAMEQSPESIAITDLQGRIVYINPAFLRQTGYSREEVLDQNPRMLQSGKTPHEVYQSMWAALQRGEIWQGEFVNRRKDGTEYTESATLTPIRQPDGTVTHYLAIKDDITERKRMVQELEVYRENLEHLVTRRTEQLAEAQHRAESANRAKSAFLANMSHEIRTPMNAIIGLTHLLQQGTPRPDQVERLAKIDRSAKHLLSIVNDILDLSKVEAGKLRIEQVDFSVAETLSVVSDSLADRARDKGLDFAFDVAPDLPDRVCGDPLRLNQILLNLGANAVKFTSAGTVTLRVMRAAGDDLRLRFEMVDSGIGMSEEQVGRMFQPFEQADASTTRRYGGTGLGLAICRGLVDLQGGQIGVTSAPGVGSTFWLELPFLPAQPLGRHVAHLSMSGVTRTIRAGVRPDQVRLLLVEDDPINQEVATDLLRSKGFHVDVAANGEEALARADEVEYDAVLMDVQMPVMDGLTATRELRKRPRTANTPILAMTASAFAEDKDACQDAGMDDFVSKPIQPDNLFATACRWTGAVLVDTQPPMMHLPTTDVAARVAAIPGLDTAIGLRVVQGNWPAYERLLRRFSNERADTVAEIRAAVAAGNGAEATRLAHTLKGLAATLGAEPLRHAALDVEHALRAERDQAELEARLVPLAQDLAALVKALCVALPPLDATAQPVADPAATRLAWNELAALLEQDDVRAVTTYRRCAPLLEGAMGDEADGLRRAVERFDFDVALALLQRHEPVA